MIETTKSVGELLITLYSKDAQARRDSVEELANFIDERVLLRLVEHLDDENKGVRDAIAQILFEHCEANPFITEPILRYIFVGSIETKNLASEIIVKIGQKSIPYMEFALTCDDRDVRKFIADTLGFIGHSDAIPFLVKVFNDEDPNVGFSSIEAVGTIGSDEGFKALEKVCKDNPDLRAMAIEAIGKIGSEDSLNVLKNYFTDEDPMVVYSCIDALSNVKTISSYNILNEAYDDLDEMSQENALDALLGLAGEVNIPEIDGKFFLGIKLKYEELSDEDEKMKTLTILSRVNDKNVIPLMLEIASENEHFQEHIFKLLCEKNYSSESELTSLISKVSGIAFELLISVISELNCKSVTVDLDKCYNESANDKKLVILEAVGILEKSEKSISLLLQGFGSDDSGLQAQAIKSLGTLGCQDQFDQFLELLNNTEEEEIAYAILESFVSMGGEKSLEFFKEMFSSPEIDDKSMALQAISALSEEETLRSIKSLILADKNEEIQLALEVIQDSELSEFNTDLISIYEHHDSDIRKSILKHVLNDKSVPDTFILNVLKDDDKWIQITALETLESTDGRLLSILEKIDISSMDPFAVRSLFDHLQKIVSDDKVKHFLIENINRVDEEIQNTLIGSVDEEFQSRLKKQLNVENN